MPNKNFYENWWFWVIVAFIIIAIAGAIMEEPETQTMTLESEEEVEQNYNYNGQEEYRDFFKEQYVIGCTENDENMLDYCECTYDYLKSEIGLDGIVQQGIDMMENPQLTPEMKEAAQNCLHLIRY